MARRGGRWIAFGAAGNAAGLGVQSV